MASSPISSDNLVATFSTGVYLPELVFVVFQMTFACITAALVLGGLAERVKFIGVVMFAILWPVLVYYPMAHMVWWWAGPDHGLDDQCGSRRRWRWLDLELRRARLRRRHRRSHQFRHRRS